ncbi:MAG TPA: GIY-YIG nuclease family protein [Phycisphaerae bacterium]|nr:GIY-YIG nuclease family protein [Phycisphaerae bacterium]HQL73020.1 GIY-YIG nuclease family protein [Phycisphaerae bacterium]
MPSKNHILSEIRRTAEANGGSPLGVRRFATETGIKESDWRGIYWVRWSEALSEAGYGGNVFVKAYTDDELLERLAGLVRDLRKFPTSAEMKLRTRSDSSFPHNRPFRRFGGQVGMARALEEYCAKHGTHHDVAQIARGYLVCHDDSDKPIPDAAEPEFGGVYLAKSGKYYKIGKSNAPGRREYELRLLMPDTLKVIHVIKTDDPTGIEEYWHKRFGARRRGGEWFDLSPADVKAFKRRKFQ